MQSSKSATLLDCIEAAKKTDDLSSSYLVTNVSKSAESRNIKCIFQSLIQYTYLNLITPLIRIDGFKDSFR